ncbi:MAG: subunit ScpB of SMC-Scp complex [Paenibacillus sp.]|nr:subunit ScpB of SMC-Scp complex [Paenibacillus sp.]
MEPRRMKAVIEGLLFVSGDEGLDLKQIADVLEVSPTVVKELLRDMKGDFKRQNRGVQIVELAGGYQLTTLPDHAPFFEKLAYSPTRTSLSQAALETLAIVAYKQPLTRIDIEDIRGVKTDRALHTLVAKDLIEEVGRAEAVGRPILYGTTKSFLTHFGLAGLQDLPEPSTVQSEEGLEEETRMLFARLDAKQLTMDDVEGNT